jgi:hypothetical protein
LVTCKFFISRNTQVGVDWFHQSSDCSDFSSRKSDREVQDASGPSMPNCSQCLRNVVWNLIRVSYSDRCPTYGAHDCICHLSQSSPTGLTSAAPPVLGATHRSPPAHCPHNLEEKARGRPGESEMSRVIRSEGRREGPRGWRGRRGSGWRQGRRRRGERRRREM